MAFGNNSNGEQTLAVTKHSAIPVGMQRLEMPSDLKKTLRKTRIREPRPNST